MEQPTLHLEKYEGPLDLLLSLVEKNKMDIADIEISLICDQYMEYISTAEDMNVELACEFILMASELMVIKSRMLLPRTEPDAEDPRAALSEALLIYKKAKEAASLMLPLYTEYSGRAVKDEDEIKPDNELPTGLDPESLSRVLRYMLMRLDAQEKAESSHLRPLVRAKVASVTDNIVRIVGRIRREKNVSLYSLLEDAQDRSSLIASFLALLELIRERQLLLDIPKAENEDDERGEIDFDVCVRLSDDAGKKDFTKKKSELDRI